MGSEEALLLPTPSPASLKTPSAARGVERQGGIRCFVKA